MERDGLRCDSPVNDQRKLRRHVDGAGQTVVRTVPGAKGRGYRKLRPITRKHTAIDAAADDLIASGTPAS